MKKTLDETSSYSMNKEVCEGEIFKNEKTFYFTIKIDKNIATG